MAISGKIVFRFPEMTFFVFPEKFPFSGTFSVFRFPENVPLFRCPENIVFRFQKKIRFAEKFLFSFSRKIFFFPFYGKFCFPKKFPFSVLNFPENVATLNKFTENRNFNKFTESRSLNETQNIGSV